MSFYFFKLDKIAVNHKRGNIPDQDVVTFNILVNQVDRGHGSGIFNGMVAGQTVPAAAVPPNNRLNIDASWNVGPLEIDPGDLVHVVYSGTNISDSQLESLSTKDQDAIELKLVDVAESAVLAPFATLGEIPAALVDAFDNIKDPVKTIIGFKAQGPCNGPVFSDAVPFAGSGLDNLAMLPPPTPQGDPFLSFTQTHTDEATHDNNVCGHFAETSVTFLVFRRASVSVRQLMAQRFPGSGPGFRQHAKPGAATISLKSLLGLRA
jgi:hypothetical protein